ncbi:MAG: protein kinase [Acidobacteriota bacterium]
MPFTSGTYIGYYKITHSLGSGGMGEIYLAEDTRLDRKVALKILPNDLIQDKKRLSRFEQEARAVSALNHPNIITLHEIGKTEQAHFLVTEFIEGETLRQRLSHSRMELLEVVDVAMQTANALVAAHQARIIHRDIKPDNIMLRPDGYVKVLDFGIAKLTQEFASPSSLDLDSEETLMQTAVKTEPGMIIGSPNYMSPEQARGLAVDERTDIFSLGVCLYEMLARRRPFQGETVSDLIVAILTKEPAPLAQYVPEIPLRLEQAIKKALAKEVSERYQTVAEMLADLKRVKYRLEYQAGMEPSLPPEPSSPPTGERRQINTSEDLKATVEMSETELLHSGETEKVVSQTIQQPASKKYYWIGGALMLLVAAIAVIFFISNKAQGKINSLAVLPFTNISGDAAKDYLSDGIAESLINHLSRSSHLKVMSRNSTFQYRGQPDAREIQRALGVDAVLMGRVNEQADEVIINAELIDARDNSQIWGERYTRKRADLLTLQEEIARQVAGHLNLTLTSEEQKQLVKSQPANSEAFDFYLRGRYQWNKRTPAAMESGIEYFKQAIAEDPAYALAFAGMADCYSLLGEYGKMPTTESSPLAKAAAIKALELDDSLAEAHTSLAAVYEYEWNWAEAEKEYRLAIAKNINYATAHHWYGIFLSSMGRHDEAYVTLKKAVELDPLSMIINTGLGRALCSARRYDEAALQLQKTLAIEPNFAEGHFQLALVYEGQGKYTEAAAAFTRALELFQDPTMKGWVAREYAIAGKRTEATKILNELQTLGKQQYVSPYMIAIVYAAMNERDRAFEWLDKVCEEKSYYVVWLKVDPVFDGFRSDPRFQSILQRIGLPQ